MSGGAEPKTARVRPLPAVPRASQRVARRSTARAWLLGAVVTICAMLAALFLHASPAAWAIGGIVVLVLLVASAPIARAAERRRRAAHPLEPWMQDHAWDPRGAAVTPLGRLLRGDRDLALTAFMFPVLAFGVALSPRAPLWLAVACAAAPVTAWTIAAWRSAAIGTARVTFTRFPYHPGERVTLHFGMAEGGASFERVLFRLSRIDEPRRVPFRHERFVVAPACLPDERPPGALPGPGQEVEVSFDVPGDAPGTALSAREPRYWTLDVQGETSAGPYAETFLVPIYDRPAAVTA